MNTTHHQRRHRTGFTLVELLIVIAIIGLLVGLALPALRGALSKGTDTAIKADVTAVSKAIEDYQLEYGDYPPDFSDWDVVQRHYRKLFPRISVDDAELLTNMTHTSGTFDPTLIDRAEALAWAVGNYSKNTQRPFTGEGGPLTWVGAGTYAAATSTDRQNPANYQINGDRVNAHFPMQGRLNLTEIDSSTAVSPTNRYLSTDDNDLLPTISYKLGSGPHVYFDSRTYAQFDVGVDDFNGYGSTSFGVVRPYYSQQSVKNPTAANYAGESDALKGWEFINPDTFQVISPGQDGSFGTTAHYEVGDSDMFTEPLYFQYPTGIGIAPRTDVDTPGNLFVSGVKGYQEPSVSVYPQLDNITNFSKGKLADELP